MSIQPGPPQGPISGVGGLPDDVSVQANPHAGTVSQALDPKSVKQPGLPGITIQPEAAVAKERPVKVDQIVWHAIRAVAVVISIPVAAPFALCFLAGWTVGAFMDTSNPGEFGRDVGEGVAKVFKPLTRQWDGVQAGLNGLTPKEYKWAVKNQEYSLLKPPTNTAPLNVTPNSSASIDAEKKRREELARKEQEAQKQATQQEAGTDLVVPPINQGIQEPAPDKQPPPPANK